MLRLTIIPITIPDGVVLASGETYTVPGNLVFVQPSHPYISGSKEGYDLTLNGAYRGSVTIEFVPPEYTYMTAKVLKGDGSPAGDALYAGHRYLAEVSFTNTYQTGLQWDNMRGSLGDTAPIHWYPDTRLAFSQNNETDAYLVQDVMPGETATFHGYFEVPESMPEGRKTLQFNAEILGADYSLPIAPPEQTFYIHTSDPVIREVNLSSSKYTEPRLGEFFQTPDDLSGADCSILNSGLYFGNYWDADSAEYNGLRIEAGTDCYYKVEIEAPAGKKFAEDVSFKLNDITPDRVEKYGNTAELYFDCSIPDSDHLSTLFHDSYINEKIDLIWDKQDFKYGSAAFNKGMATAGLLLSAQIENNMDELQQCFYDLGLVARDDYNHGQEMYASNETAAVITGHAFAIRELNLYNHADPENLITIVAKGTTSAKDGIVDIAPWGFETAANQVMETLKVFLERNGTSISDPQNIYLVTGHSLGGAVANKVAAKLLHDYDCDRVFGYTFASPYTCIQIDKKNNVNYHGIHNLVNTKDLVPKLGQSRAFGRDYQRFGDDFSFTSATWEKEFAAQYKQLTGRDWNDWWTDPLEWHYTRTYMAYLMSRKDAPASLSGRQVRAEIHCPVDVEVLDASGNVLASVIGKKVTMPTVEGLQIIAQADGGKVVLMDPAVDYTLRLTGTDTGEMNYTVQMQEFTAEGTTILSEKSFEKVALTAGKKMISPIKKGVTAKEVPLFVLDDKGAVDKDVQPDGTEVKHKHAYGDWQVVTASTCTQPGQERRVCGLCGTEETRPLPLAEHEYVYGVCQICGAKDPNYVAIPHKIIVENGRVFADGKEISDAVPGTKVTVVANAASDDLLFDFWEVVGDLKLEAPNQQETSFVMPECDVTLRAKYKVNPEHEDEHVHELDDVWHSDGNGHWHECPCGAKGGISLHEFGEWEDLVAATATEPGQAVRTCRVCGYRMTSLTPALGEAAAPATGDPGNAVWWTLLALSLAGIGTTAVKRRRNHSAR